MLTARQAVTFDHLTGGGRLALHIITGGDEADQCREGDFVHDTRLWTRVAAITGAAGNSTALVGTPEQVAEALLAYVDMGIDLLLIRGFLPLKDAIEYGRELIPLVRAEVARREAAVAAR